MCHFLIKVKQSYILILTSYKGNLGGDENLIQIETITKNFKFKCLLGQPNQCIKSQY
jgi:hypothetical protein